MANQRFKTVMLFGAPGTGKGTQGKILGAVPGFFHFSSGEMFRALNASSEIGRIFLEYSSRGELVPDDVTIRLWKEHVDALITLNRFQPDKQLLVLDGIPRSANQARLMDEHIDVLHVVHLASSDPGVLVERLRRRAMLESRNDDARDDVIQRRLEVYEQETRPVLEHYPRSTVSEIDAIGTPAEVLLRVLNVLVLRRPG